MPLRLLLLLSLFLPALASAQGRPPSGEPAQFRITTIDTRVRGAYYQPRGDRPRALRLSPSYIAGPYPFAPGAPLQIFRREGEAPARLMAEARIPAAVTQPLLLLLPVPAQGPDETALPYAAVVIDDSLQAAPLNTMRFINLSDLPVVVALGGMSPKRIDARAQLVLPFAPPASGGGYQSLNIARQSPSGQWERLTSAEENEVYLEAGTRFLTIIRPTAAGSTGGERVAPFAIIHDAHHIPPQPAS
ncbi:MAG: hypothetical protein ABII82_03055 [Verrucomicrobiota bacterium]